MAQFNFAMYIFLMDYTDNRLSVDIKWVDNSPVNTKWRYLDYEVSPSCYILMLNYLIHDGKAGIAHVSWIFILQ